MGGKYVVGKEDGEEREKREGRREGVGLTWGG
jgi:hypothetical protein